MPEPVVAHHNGMEVTRFGAYADLPREALEYGSADLGIGRFGVKLFEDTDQMVWEKFIMNVAFSGSTTSTGMTIGEVMANPSAWDIAESCAREAIAGAEAAGIHLDVGDPIEHVRSLDPKIPSARPSMLLNANLRRRKEVDAIPGAVVVDGSKYGVDARVYRTIANVIRAREALYLNQPS